MTITREGWVAVQKYDIGYILLQCVLGREAFIAWLKQYGIDASPSDAGQVADQLIGAAQSLYACGMFSDLATLRLLDDMASSRVRGFQNGNKTLTKVPDRTKNANEIQNHFKARKSRTWGFWGSLDYFLERSVFRAGMRVQCPKCAFYNWYDLDLLKYALTCSRCLKNFSFDQSPDELRKVNWYYRVIGPFATPDYAQGGYAVALTLRRFQIEMEGGGLTWSTGLELKPLNVEVDFLGWYRPRGSIFSHEEQREPVLLVGEAKSFARQCFSDDEISKLKTVALTFQSAFIVVSILKLGSELSPEEIVLLTGLAEWGRLQTLKGRSRFPVILLTGAELLTDHHIKQVWEEIGGKAASLVMHASTFLDDPMTLSDLTLQLYLGLPSYFEHLSKIYPERRKILTLIAKRQAALP